LQATNHARTPRPRLSVGLEEIRVNTVWYDDDAVGRDGLALHQEIPNAGADSDHQVHILRVAGQLVEVGPVEGDNKRNALTARHFKAYLSTPEWVSMDQVIAAGPLGECDALGEVLEARFQDADGEVAE
jgi:hypothetical protein